ncbi:MAG TPA: prolyl oligopeptidase family serine peptidase [Pyrinomonadaceae bacterium]|nr:prolyl oligopeptidase family serine peptidase [Pyrinomonadaceae bacterium]
MSKDLWSALSGVLSAGAAALGRGRAEVQSRTVRAGGDTYTYQLHVPAKTEGPAPVIVFLHGITQRGAGGYLPTSGAAGAVVGGYLARVPVAVLLPQCRAGSYWSDPVMDEMVTRSLEESVKELRADESRLYLAGVSMGGYGVWSLAMQHPSRFAALVSVCGGSPLRAGERFKPVAEKVGRTPAWLFHGADDRVVPPSESRQMVAALEAAGGNVRYSEYPGIGHNVWTKVLAEKQLMPWLLSQRRA